MRECILEMFLQHGHEYISEYPDKTVKQQERPISSANSRPESSSAAPISIRAKAHELFETIISFVLRTLPIYPIMIPHVPGLMWFGRSSPWEHKLAQDIDVLGAAEAPRFRQRAAAGEPLKSGIGMPSIIPMKKNLFEPKYQVLHHTFTMELEQTDCFPLCGRMCRYSVTLLPEALFFHFLFSHTLLQLPVAAMMRKAIMKIELFVSC
jgi:hypothetical protein